MTENLIGISMGDPSGVGPEIILKSLEKLNPSDFLVIGDYSVLELMREKLKYEKYKINKINNIDEFIDDLNTINILDMNLIDISNFEVGKVNANSGNAAFRYVVKAIELAKDGYIKAVVTAPINKEAMNLAGHKYAGHTEIFASYTDTKDYAMILSDEKLKVIHASTHVALRDAIDNLRPERINNVLELAYDFMKKIGVDRPKIAVAGINPHASENGMFGTEESNVIIPGIYSFLENKYDCEVIGPVPPDTVFLKAYKGEYDIVVAMYHDQGHIPLKMLGFDTGVNVTAGLPIIRTSVDHGTAFDIAWKGIADCTSMLSAIELAKKMSK